MENRIQNIIEKYELSSNTFAQEIDVNRLLYHIFYLVVISLVLRFCKRY